MSTVISRSLITTVVLVLGFVLCAIKLSFAVGEPNTYIEDTTVTVCASHYNSIRSIEDDTAESEVEVGLADNTGRVWRIPNNPPLFSITDDRIILTQEQVEILSAQET